MYLSLLTYETFEIEWKAKPFIKIRSSAGNIQHNCNISFLQSKSYISVR